MEDNRWTMELVEGMRFRSLDANSKTSCRWEDHPFLGRLVDKGETSQDGFSKAVQYGIQSEMYSWGKVEF